MTMHEKWQVLSTRTLLVDRWINVRADSCVTTSGTKIDPYYVLTYPDWVHVVALTKDDCLVMVQQYRHAARKVFLELPGGIVDPTDVRIEDAAERELLEETGYRSSNMQRVASLYTNPATHTNRVHTCVATDSFLNENQRLDDGEEGMTVELVPIPFVLQSLQSCGVEQSMHISSIITALAAIGRIIL
jgi:8-oxo-dGTP pyrophosphatase MutT (NUDIX family)